MVAPPRDSRWRTSACRSTNPEISIPTLPMWSGGDNAMSMCVCRSCPAVRPAATWVTVRRDSTRATWPGFRQFADYSFSVYQDDEEGGGRRNRRRGQPEGETRPSRLSNAGAARVSLATPKVERPHSLVADMEYKDPNGEIYTAQARTTVWPSAVLIGIKTSDWAMAREKLVYDIITTDVTGKPVGGMKFR